MIFLASQKYAHKMQDSCRSNRATLQHDHRCDFARNLAYVRSYLNWIFFTSFTVRGSTQSAVNKRLNDYKSFFRSDDSLLV